MTTHVLRRKIRKLEKRNRELEKTVATVLSNHKRPSFQIIDNGEDFFFIDHDSEFLIEPRYIDSFIRSFIQ